MTRVPALTWYSANLGAVAVCFPKISSRSALVGVARDHVKDFCSHLDRCPWLREQVQVPVGMMCGASERAEYGPTAVDLLIREWIDPLGSAPTSLVMNENDWQSFERRTDAATVGAKLLDNLGIEVDLIWHERSLSAT